MNKKSKNKVIFFVVLIVALFMLILLNIVKANDSGEKIKMPEIAVAEEISLDDNQDAMEYMIAKDEIEIKNNDIQYESTEDIVNQNAVSRDIANKDNNNQDSSIMDSIYNGEEYVSKTTEDGFVNKRILKFDNNINENKETSVSMIKGAGELKGACITSNINKKYIASVYIYESGKVDWNSNAYGSNYYKRISTKDDGTFNVNLDDGEYDVYIDVEGYLDYIIKNVKITPNKTISLAAKTLTPGDVNKDGIVNITDVSILEENYASRKGDKLYTLSCDFNQDEMIDLSDLVATRTNENAKKTIEKFQN